MIDNLTDKIKVGITIGDINGIGPEVIVKVLSDNRILQSFTPVIYGASKVLSYYVKSLNLQRLNFQGISNATEALPKSINTINCWEGKLNFNIGSPSADAGKLAFKSLETAVQDLASNKIDVLVTGPINKKSMQDQGFSFPGHTEYLAHYSNVNEALMLMVSNNLRVAVVTGHIPLKEVSTKLTPDLLAEKIELLHQSLQIDFDIARPRIAVLGLNPHAGEDGKIGVEDQEIIKPAIQNANTKSILAFGPYPADGLFGSGAYAKFDGILAMYHDQGLAPFKALTFDNGVNFTAGLPVVRTSPDHGTAYDIAGKNLASPQSMREAIWMACDIYNRRKAYKALRKMSEARKNLSQQ